MQIGGFMWATDQSMSAVEFGRALEDRGFESVFFGEHTHIPVNRTSPWPGGAEMPPQYPRMLDPFVALAATAAVTERIKLGLAVCLVIERDPIVLAKEVASLDLISNGRVLFGVGGGWNHEEMANHGTDPAQRWKILRERVAALKTIWANDEAEYHGQFVNFDPIWQWPKPVQKPHPPILIGGSGKYTFRRIVDYGDEWLPIHGRDRTPLPESIAELQRLAEVAGRGPSPVSLLGATPHPRAIERYRAAGVTRCVFMAPAPGRREDVLPLIDEWAKVIAE